ncbi:hypothetical protein [Ornithinibacillus halotolerans]|uniref:Uncharacterized protein n=1 Tax=Ornithinibacillus halotolerans TaxID=1274357 RepID=A0A916WAX1_9BACI|nr:hypothetical protein [Ornithinibacillus halotolerans]GGA81598.1 hypothetical protein GCM10008025_26110 [Ornithinibacillus halotolerans]
MSKWFLLNFVLLIVIVWNVVGHYSFPRLPVHIVFGVIGALIFLYNWTRNAVFETIRNVRSRKTKVALARFSRKVVTIHRWTGNIALLAIVIHGLLVISTYGFSLNNIKMVVGVLALIGLTLQILTGWLRLYKPTINLRYIHLYNGMMLFFLILVHILM